MKAPQNAAKPYNPALSGNPQSATSRAYPNGDPKADLNSPGARNTDSCLPLHPATPVKHEFRCEGAAPGNLAFRWAFGSPIAARNREPRIQVMQYNEDTYILRQNLCVHWEAPFTYLLFGNERALLIDTGATANSVHYPLRPTVDAILARWSSIRRRPAPLTVVMTSPEDIAQNQGLSQFKNRPETQLLPVSGNEVSRFYGVAAQEKKRLEEIDLGDRVVTVIPTPGTHRDGVSFYDPYTRFLFTGDFLFPGKIQIANERDYIASLRRLQQFIAQRPVRYVMGGHIEMQFLPGKAYPRFYTYKPYEHVLELSPDHIGEALDAALELQGRHTVLVRADFQLLHRVSPDEKSPIFPSSLPNITGPRFF